MSRSVCVSLAAFPRLSHACSAAKAHEGAFEPLFGRLSTDHLQLVPQSKGIVDDVLAGFLTETYPGTKFRLHANARVLDDHVFADLSTFKEDRAWFRQAAKISQLLKAEAYSAHSGRREHSTMSEMLDNARAAADLFQVPIAIEGQYPTKTDSFIVSTWDEYQELFESGLPYALDLSHLNILARHTNKFDLGLISEMLSCDRCLEVHVSSNDGRRDSHDVAREGDWWVPLLAEVHSAAVIFSEGNHLV